MPVGLFGQLITFAIVKSDDDRFSGFRYVHTTKALNTVAKIANRYGHSTDARQIADDNKIRHTDSPLKKGRRLRIPDYMRKAASFSVLAGDQPPRVTGGYSKIDVVDRTERAGLSIFKGYDPITIEIPVRFESEDRRGSWHGADGSEVERQITLLEKMAGRGNFAGAAVGAPAIVEISSTAGNDVIPLIPLNYQRSQANPSAPFYWISGIDWDADAQRNDHGERIRQLATITVMSYVAPDSIQESAALRAKAKKPKKKKKK